MRVMKLGGNELDNLTFLRDLCQLVAEQDESSIIVHGGGKSIAHLQERLGLATRKVDGLRVTDAQSLIVAEMVLSGTMNKLVVKNLLLAGVPAIGLSGIDGGLLRCRKKQHSSEDLGYVGEITDVNADFLQVLLNQGMTPVISPISLGVDGQTYNVNADEAATAIAASLGATALDFVSNVPGVMHNERLLPLLQLSEAQQLIEDGVIQGGMIPKVRAALTAVCSGVGQARIVDLRGLRDDGGTWFHGRAVSPASPGQQPHVI